MNTPRLSTVGLRPNVRPLAALMLLSLAFSSLTSASAQVTNLGTLGRPGSEERPAPDWIAADIPRIVNSPSPSDVNPSLLGPVLMVKSARVDLGAGTVTLPLHEGRMASGERVWYIITDTSDKGLSDLLGVNYAPKMVYTNLGNGVREATVESDGTVVFSRGAVDFAPEWTLAPGEAPDFFPPQVNEPGSVGDQFYTPLFRTTNGGDTVVYNAPVLAYDIDAATLNLFCNGDADKSIVHDKVVAICPEEGTVTLRLTLGYSFAKPVLYLSLDANNEIAATLEEATLTPVYDQQGFSLPDAAIGSGVERIFAVTNGPTGSDNPDRQGFNSALSDGRGPINVLGGIPTFNLDYSPIWKLFMVSWTPEAIEAGYDTRIIDIFQALQYNARGYLVNIDGNAEFSPSGIAINCPIIMRLN